MLVRHGLHQQLAGLRIGGLVVGGGREAGVAEGKEGEGGLEAGVDVKDGSLGRQGRAGEGDPEECAAKGHGRTCLSVEWKTGDPSIPGRSILEEAYHL